MSVKVSSWVWHGDECSDLDGNELVLMLALADVAGDEGRCRYMDDETDLTYSALATKVRVDRRTIIRLVAKLRQRGLLSQVPGQKGRPNEFTVVVPWARKRTGDKLSPVDETEPVTSETEPVTTQAGTGDNDNIDSSYRRIDVSDVGTSAVADAETLGQRFAQPLCEVLVAELIRNEVKVPSPLPKKWLDDARLMIDRDERDPHQAKALIEWACRDSFWRSNVQSMPTFRKQYDKLRLQAQERRPGVKKTTVDHGREVDRILRERAAASERLAVSA